MEFIEFPKLAIKLFIDPVAFTLGPFKVHWYGIIIAVAILIALTLAMKQSKKFGIKEDDLIDMFLFALPVSIVFARLFYVVFKLNDFKNDFWGIFRIWEGGIAIYGALIGAILVVYFFTKARKMNMLDLCDFACVYLPLAQAIGRWGNFVNQELYGTPTTLPWGMTGSRIQREAAPENMNALVHPTFLYESLWNVLVFIVLLRLRKNKKVKGSVIGWYLLLYSLGRFLIEFIRVDEFQAGSIRYNQLFAAVVFIGALIFMFMLNKKAKEQVVVEENVRSAYADVLDNMKDNSEPEAINSNDNDGSVSDNEIEAAVDEEVANDDEATGDSEIAGETVKEEPERPKEQE